MTVEDLTESKVIQRTFPELVSVEIMSTLNRLPGTINSGASPGRA